MVYDSVYEANNYLRGTARKQHFWDWFSGSKLQEASAITYEDDFSSSSGYTFATGNSISGGVLTFKPAGSLGFTKALGFTMDNEKWVMRVHGYTLQSGFSWSAAMSSMFGFSDQSGLVAYNGSGNNFGFNIHPRTSAGYTVNNVRSKLNGSMSTGGNATVGERATDLVVGTKYYIECKRTSATSGELRIYSDSNFTTLHTTAYVSDVTMNASTGLTHLSLQGQTSGGNHVVTCDKIVIYNGVTSASDTPIRWTTNNVTGTGTFEMVDEADGGFKIITSTSSTAKQSITFNDIRQYDPTASEVIMILKRITDDGGINGNFNAGLSNGSTTYPSHSVVVTNYRNDTYYSLSSTASTGVSRSASTTPTDTEWHTHKLINGSSDLKLNIDGVLGVTRTAHRPTIEMQPIVYSNSTSLASETRVRYFEAYNT